jgi:hypothetical protein
MADNSRHHGPRTRPVPQELVDMVRDCLGRRGPKAAADALGVSRFVVLAVAAGTEVTPGSLALLREALRRKEAA